MVDKLQVQMTDVLLGADYDLALYASESVTTPLYPGASITILNAIVQFLPAGARERLVLRLLYVLRVCLFVCLSVCLCVRTYHVRNDYVTYTVAMRLDRDLIDLTVSVPCSYYE